MILRAFGKGLRPESTVGGAPGENSTSELQVHLLFGSNLKK